MALPNGPASELTFLRGMLVRLAEEGVGDLVLMGAEAGAAKAFTVVEAARMEVERPRSFLKERPCIYDSLWMYVCIYVCVK